MRGPEFFLHRYARTTNKIAFIEAPYDAVVDVVLAHDRYLDEFWKAPPFKATHVDGPLTAKLDALPPLVSIYPTKTLLTATRSGWTAYLANHVHGGDVSSQPSHIARTKLHARVLNVTLTKDVPGGQPGSTQFVVADYRGGDVEPVVRAVMAHKESRWEFDAYGEPFAVEEVERYGERRIKDRLTPEMVERYCRHLGIELFDPDFYAGPATVIECFPTAPNKFFDHFPNLEPQVG